MMTRKLILTLLAISSLCLLASCGGPAAFTRGDYDNPERVNLLNDQFSETDMQQMVHTLVYSLIHSRAIAKAQKPPVVMVTHLDNKTDEHIDTQSIMDMVKVELGKTGAVQFIDKEARSDVAQEYQYENSGTTEAQSTHSMGKQVGADYILNGRLDSIVQEVGSDKTVYYKITLYLTDMNKNISVWQDQDQIRKVYQKHNIGM